MGGFVGSSNVLAGFKFGVPILGTIAHSFIMAFECEEDVANSKILTLKDGSQIDLLAEALAYRD